MDLTQHLILRKIIYDRNQCLTCELDFTTSTFRLKPLLLLRIDKKYLKIDYFCRTWVNCAVIINVNGRLHTRPTWRNGIEYGQRILHCTGADQLCIVTHEHTDERKVTRNRKPDTKAGPVPLKVQ